MSINYNEPLLMTPELQRQLTPADALELLRAGNERFLKNQRFDRDLHAQVQHTASGQYPFAVVLSCIDSRIPTEIVLDQGIGDIFNVRIAGNFVNNDILGSMEFACAVACSKLIVVMGHTSCGAVKGACDGVQLGHLTEMLQAIEPAVEATPTAPGEERSSKNIEFVNRVAQKNVELTMARILEESVVLRGLYEQGRIGMVGAMYDVATGRVHFDPLQHRHHA